jgi:hypothetical protein
VEPGGVASPLGSFPSVVLFAAFPEPCVIAILRGPLVLPQLLNQNAGTTLSGASPSANLAGRGERRKAILPSKQADSPEELLKTVV